MLGPASSLFDQVILTDGSIIGVDTLTDAQFDMVESGIRNDGPCSPWSCWTAAHLEYSTFGPMALDSASSWWTPKPWCWPGARPRYLRGTGYYEVNAEERGPMRHSIGVRSGLVAPDATLGSALRPAGFGLTLDLSARIEVANLWFASIAVTDIGSMDWQGERYSLNNPVTTFEDWNPQDGGVFDLLNNGLAPSALFLEATPERRVVDMPTRVTVNGGMMVGRSHMVGIELSAPLNDALLKQPAEVGIGGQTRLGPLLGMGACDGGGRRRALAHCSIWNRKDRPHSLAWPQTTCSDGSLPNAVGAGAEFDANNRFGTGFEGGSEPFYSQA